MKEWTRRVAALGAAALILAPIAHAGKLDLDIYASRTAIPRAAPDGPERTRYNWIPGDPKAERGAPKWVKHLSHAGYAGLGAAGLAGCIASGGVAPAIGFGLVALVQSYLEWREIKTPSE
jgi:hypothetical protein